MAIDTIDLLKHIGETGGFKGLEINLSVEDFFEVVCGLQKSEIVFDKCDFTFVNKTKKIGRGLEKSIVFRDCRFNSKVMWRHITVSGLIHDKGIFTFENCIFSNSVKFSEMVIGVPMSFDPPICFIKCDLMSVAIADFKAHNRNFYLSFSECKSQSIVVSNIDKLLLDLDSSEIGSLEISTIYETLEIFPELAVIGKTVIQNVKELVINDFIDTQIYKIENCPKITKPFFINDNSECEFEKSTFDGAVRVWENIEIEQGKPIVALDCTFNEIVDLSTCNRSRVRIENSTFRKKLWIAYASIDSLAFRNCKFEDTVKIFNLKNNISSADFSTSTIKGLFLFNGWDGERLCFEKEANIDFSHIFIEPSGYLIIRNVNDDKNYNGSFIFSCANILGNVVFSDVYANSLDLEHSSIVGNFNVEKTEFNDYVNSQTLVKLKNEAIKKNDTIKALEYKGEEMVKYRGELRKKGIFKNLKERFLITLNTCSNNNGQSWTRGLVFTLGLAVFFCLLLDFGAESRIYCTWNGWDSCKIIFERFLAVINIFHFETDSESASEALKLNIGGNYIFFLSKIVVGYGIYQTIAAFRKYGKQ